MASTISKSEYARQRDNYLRSIRRYRARLAKEGVTNFDFSSYIPSIPKNLDKTTEEVEKEFNSLRRQLTFAVGTKRAIKKKREESRLNQLKNGINSKFTIEGKQQKLTPESKKRKKDFENKINKVISSKSKITPTAPKLSDAILNTFEGMFAEAKTYISSKPSKYNAYQEAVRKAGYEVDTRKTLEIGKILSKYTPDLTKDDVRVAVSKNLEENFNDLWSKMEQYLYEFVSDNQGNLDHTSASIDGYLEFFERITGTTIDIEDKKRIEELKNASIVGEPVTNPDKTDI